MMTKEREKEIRAWILDACGSGHPINELLAELDRVRDIANENAESCEALSREMDRVLVQSIDPETGTIKL